MHDLIDCMTRPSPNTAVGRHRIDPLHTPSVSDSHLLPCKWVGPLNFWGTPRHRVDHRGVAPVANSHGISPRELDEHFTAAGRSPLGAR